MNTICLDSLVVSMLLRIPKMFCKIAILYYLREVAFKATNWLVREEGYQVDGKRVTDVRPIWSKAVCLPRVHGSAFFDEFH